MPPRMLYGRLHVMGTLKTLALTALIALLALGVSGNTSALSGRASLHLSFCAVLLHNMRLLCFMPGLLGLLSSHVPLRASKSPE